jgi:hypothetical protein
MATWEDQNGPEPVEPVEKCCYLVRKGQKPDYVSRSNIQAYQPALAADSKVWGPLLDDNGKFVTKLPPLGTVPGSQPVRIVREPIFKEVGEKVVDEKVIDMEDQQIFEVFSNLEPVDFKPTGYPKISAVRTLMGDTKITEDEMKLKYDKFKGEEK